METFNYKEEDEILLSNKKIIFLIKFFCSQQEFNQRIDLSFKDNSENNKAIYIIKKNVMQKFKEFFFFNDISIELLNNEIFFDNKKKKNDKLSKIK